MLNITNLIHEERARARKPKAKAPLLRVRSPLDAEVTLNRIVYDLGLRKVLSRAQVKRLAAELQFPVESRILFRVGSELVFILAEQFQHVPDTEIIAVFAAIAPSLTFKRKLLRGDNPKELRTAWVYMEIEPPTRRLPAFEYAWEYRQSLWAFL